MSWILHFNYLIVLLFIFKFGNAIYIFRTELCIGSVFVNKIWSYQLTPNLGEKHAVPHNMHPQARLSEFDKTWHLSSPYGPSSGNGVLFF